MARRNPARVPDQSELGRREDRLRDDYDHDYAGTSGQFGQDVYGGDEHGGGGYGLGPYEQSQQYGGDDFDTGAGPYGSLQRQYEQGYVSGGYPSGWPDHPARYEGRPDYGRRWPPPGRRRAPAPPGRFWHGDFDPYGSEGSGAPGRDPYYGALGYRDQGGRGENPYLYSRRRAGPYGQSTRYGNTLPWELDEGRVTFYRPRTPGRARPRGPKGYQRSDERLQELICEELLEADHVDSSEVTVTVQDGTVTLEGTVPERPMRYAIEDIADSVAGVKDIDNRIRVAPPE